MRTRYRTFASVVPALLGLLLSLEAQATSNRIFVSTTGNNANDCSNPLTPCLDFTGALSQVNAGGEIIAQATGPYGPLNITKAVTISGPPGVVIFSGHQVTVNATGATVVLRGLTIDGNGAMENGITVVAVGSLFVESCVIAGFGGIYQFTSGNGIFFGSAGNLFVNDTIVRGNGYVGIHIRPSSGTVKASIDHCQLEGNWMGLYFKSGTATVRNSVASGNSTSGFYAETSGDLNIENCLATNNDPGIFSNVGSTIRVSNTTITDNGLGLAGGGLGTLLSRGNNTVERNGTDGSFTGTFAAK